MATDFLHASTSIPDDATGYYLAYPTTSTLKPTYRGHKTLVNHEHTKVGVATKSFLSRKKEYLNTFHREVAFVPLVIVPPDALSSLEVRVLAEMYQRYPRSGSAREWFRTTDRQVIAEIVWKLSGA